MSTMDAILPFQPELAWPIWHDGVHALRANSLLLSFVHALYIAYSYRKNTPKALQTGKHAFTRGLIIHLVTALGGGTTAAIITGRPVPWLLSNDLLPIYILGYFTMTLFPMDLLFVISRSISPVSELTFDLVDAIIRAYSMASTIDHFKSTNGTVASYIKSTSSGLNPSTLIWPQLVVGVVSVTMGGIYWKWFLAGVVPGVVNESSTAVNSYPAFQYPGWDFNVIIVSTFTYIYGTGGYKTINAYWKEAKAFQGSSLMLAYLVHAVDFFWAEVYPVVRRYATLLGVPVKMASGDWKVLCSLIILVGFWIRPRPVATASAGKVQAASARANPQTTVVPPVSQKQKVGGADGASSSSVGGGSGSGSGKAGHEGKKKK
ncbi:hypothetical protein HDU76_013583 [Blyttiomyces sp. JEL0837]|nr:hypothetical protein HDU76_013583 [Blyttiomyces sp. JEL0837]